MLISSRRSFFRRFSSLAVAGALSGSGCDDGLPVGSTLVYRWEYHGGPVEIAPVIADATAPSTTVRLLVPGQYLFRLVATDSARSSEDWVVLTLRPANQAPVVDAGADRIVDHPATSTMVTGTVSDDGLPEGSALAHSWHVVGPQPGSVVFASPGALATQVQFGATGTYRLALTAGDGGDFFPQLATHWKKNYAGWTAWVLTPDLKLPKLMRLKESRRVPMWNGPIECRLFRFDMVAGSARR